MSNTSEIIELLKNESLINEYVKYLKNCIQDVITRSKEKANTIACRLWQLEYCIFTIVYNTRPDLIRNARYLYNLCKHFINIFTSTSSKLYRFIAQNSLSPNLSFLCYRTDEANFKEHITRNITRNINSYLCIYGIDKITNLIHPGGVVHYFTIIKNNEEYYITSSWGSSYICVPYSITILTINEFYTFCHNLRSHAVDPNNSVVTQELTNFMIKYFLHNPIPIRFSEEDIEFQPELRDKYIPPEEGLRREIEYVLNNSLMNFDVAIVSNYEELVMEALQTSVGGKKIKYNRSKNPKHKNPKHKNPKHKNPKHKKPKSIKHKHKKNNHKKTQSIYKTRQPNLST